MKILENLFCKLNQVKNILVNEVTVTNPFIAYSIQNHMSFLDLEELF